MTSSHHWLLAPGLSLLAVSACEVAQATQYLSLAQAQTALFSTATEFRPTLLALTEVQRAQLKTSAKTRTPLPEHSVYQVLAHGKALGWFIVDEVYGKHEFITYAVGLNPAGEVLGVEIMDYRETHGYQVRNLDWRRQFVGKRLGAPLKLEQDIRNIAGATLSCLHIAEGLRRLLHLHAMILK